MSEHYQHTKKGEYNGDAKDIATSSVGSHDIFLAKFVEMYKENTNDFCGSLVVDLSKAVIAKMDGYKNLPTSTKVLIFSEC